MASLEDILESINGTDYYEDTVQYVIDENLRTIEIPTGGVVLGALGDKNTNRVNFVMTRYYNGFDLSTFNIRVNYTVGKDYMNYYTVNDIKSESNHIMFTWLCAADVYQRVGDVKFSVELAAGASNIFNTTVATAKVLESIRVDDYINPDDFVSVTDRLLGEIETAGSTALTRISNAQTTATNAVTSQQTNSVNAVKSQQTTSVNAVTSAKSNALTDIDTLKTSASTAISTARSDAIADINDTKSEAIAQINGVINTAPTDYTALSRLAKQNERKINALYKLSEGIAYEFETQNNLANPVTIPTGVKAVDVQMLCGKSVVMNQYAGYIQNTTTTNGLTFTNNGDGTVTVNGTATANTFSFNIMPSAVEFTKKAFHNNHKYLVLGATSAVRIMPQLYTDTNWATNLTAITEDSIITISHATANALRGFLYVYSGTTVNNVTIKPQIIDLTQMFGAGNEPTLEQCRAIFKTNTYPYTAPTIKHCAVSGIEVTGKNILDFEEWKRSLVATVGGKTVPDGNGIRLTASAGDCYTAYGNGNTLEIPVKPNTQYTLSWDIGYRTDANTTYGVVYAFDFNGAASVNNNAVSTTRKLTFTTKGRFIQIRFGVTGAGQSLTYKDIMLTEGSTPQAYAQYHHEVISLPSAITSLDGYGWSAGSVYNYIDFERKKFVKRVGRLDIGRASWTRYNFVSNYAVFLTNVTDRLANSNNVVSEYNYSLESPSGSSFPNKSCNSTSNSKYIYIRDDDYASGAAFMSGKNGTYIYYELETPVEIDISDIIDVFEVEAGGTMRFITGDDLNIPVPNTTQYLVKLNEV